MANLYSDYESYVKKAIEEFGSNTLVLYQCGGFFEVYSIEDGLVDIKKVSELLNVQVSRRNKSILEVSRKNALMAGWPLHAMGRFLPILIENNYTVVIVEQVTPPPNPVRRVTKVYSKGTTIDYGIHQDSKHTMCIYLDENKSYGLAAGCSIVDTTTGVSQVLEISQRGISDKDYVFHDLSRVVSQYRPCEVVLISDIMTYGADDVSKIKTSLGLQKGTINIINWLGRLSDDVKNVTLQNKFLGSIFEPSNMLTPIEFLGLERNCYALISYITLLRYVSRHNESLVLNFKPPKIITDNNEIILSHNAAEQLDAEGLLKIINLCVTSMGKRYFRERFMHASTCAETIRSSLERIEKSLVLGIDEIVKVRSELRRTYDIERLFRRVQLGCLYPVEIGHIYTSLEALVKVRNSKEVQHIKGYFEENFDIDACSRCTLDDMRACAFIRHDDIHKLSLVVSQIEKRLDDIEKAFDMVSTTGFFKVDKTAFTIVVTSKRWSDFKKKNQVIVGGLDMEGFTQKPGPASSIYLSHPQLDDLGKDYKVATEALHDLQRERYHHILRDVSKTLVTEFHQLCSDIKSLDFETTCAYLALKFNYTKPEIIDMDNKPYVTAQGLRHPIVERIEEQTSYIGNDVSLGGDKERGWLLYGLNAAGKSTLMKSIALSVWMAQAGMYVPATIFRLSPFSAIFTRITRGDNLYEGQSTFIIEMSELRNILRRCDNRSLIIGDELCSGTEAASAVGIVSAGIVSLSKIDACFIFATHLHELPTITLVKHIIDKGELGVYHLHVEYDSTTSRLLYDRKLRPGQGCSMYGIEVCKALDLGDTFITMALNARNEHHKTRSYPDVFDAKPSPYNSNTRVQRCAVCNEVGYEVHHISHQKDADQKGFITRTGTHKNHGSNLVVLCTTCHDKVHQNELQIKGYMRTSTGIELILEKNNHDKNAIEEIIRNKRFVERKTLSLIAKEVGVSLHKVKKALKS